MTIEACIDKERPGVMCVISEGPIARRLCKLDAPARRAAILAELVKRFGFKANSPEDYIERIWTVERYSAGGMIGHTPTGGLTDPGTRCVSRAAASIGRARKARR